MFKQHRRVWLLLVTAASLILLGSVFTQRSSEYNFKTFTDNETWFKMINETFFPEKNAFKLRYSTGERPVSAYGNLKHYPPPEKNLADRYIIYRCSSASVCGGLADRQKGIVTSYVLSQMLRRKFGIMMNKGCDFSKYVIPNEVDWIVNEDMLRGKSTETEHNVDNIGAGVLMGDRNLEKLFDKDVTYYEGNLDYLPFLMKKSSFLSLTWTQNQSHFDIYRITFSHLFKLVPSTQRKYEQFHAKTKQHFLVCAHLRMGRSKTNPQDQDLSHKQPDTLTVIQFLKSKLTNSSKFFLATDSEEVKDQFKMAFSESYVELHGKIAHIDRSGSTFDCSGMEKAILDQFILSTCDAFLMSYSGFSIVAALLRGSDDELYLVRLKNIMKVKRLHPFFQFQG